ncbi:MAG: TonB family protein [Steroidobacter sp.]
MATDTAHIKLELASGRNEVTAPFDQTAQRRRSRQAQPPAETDISDPPPIARVTVDVPVEPPREVVATPDVRLDDPEPRARPGISRTTWIAFAGVIIAVAAAMWLVMFQFLPDIDPREVIQRNLGEARIAMAEGRYTDPQERSAFHYYNTVLALDPNNSDAIAGIDAIADRHLTDARVMLGDKRIAEAGVAIERARRVRPNHSGLPELDTQLRAELRKILAATVAPVPQLQPVEPAPAKAKVAKAVEPPRLAPAARETEVAPAVSKVRELPLLARVPVDEKPTSLMTPVASEPAPAVVNEAGSAPVVDEPVNVSAPLPENAPVASVPAVAPKLIKMVQPEFPQEALMRGIEGWVDVSLEVNAAGDVLGPRVEETSRGRLFNRAALSAVQQWKYEPRTGDTSERIRVRLQFRQTKK